MLSVEYPTLATTTCAPRQRSVTLRAVESNCLAIFASPTRSPAVNVIKAIVDANLLCKRRSTGSSPPTSRSKAPYLLSWQRLGPPQPMQSFAYHPKSLSNLAHSTMSSGEALSRFPLVLLKTWWDVREVSAAGCLPKSASKLPERWLKMWEWRILVGKYLLPDDLAYPRTMAFGCEVAEPRCLGKRSQGSGVPTINMRTFWRPSCSINFLITEESVCFGRHRFAAGFQVDR